MSSRDTRPVVVAGSAQQFKSWCWENGLRMHDAIYVHTPDVLRGMSFNESRLRFAGNYYDRSDFPQIQENLELCLMRFGSTLEPVEEVDEDERLRRIIADHVVDMTTEELGQLRLQVEITTLQRNRRERARQKAVDSNAWYPGRVASDGS